MQENWKEVYFNQYCPRCECFDCNDYEDLCNECLNNPMNLYSHKPVNWKEKENNG